MSTTKFQDATTKEIDSILEKSYEAFLIYRNYSLKQRADFMHAIAKHLERIRGSVIPVAMQETNLPEARMNGELSRTIFQLNSYADAAEQGDWLEARIDTALPDRKPAPKPDLRKMLVPLGPVVVFGAS